MFKFLKIIKTVKKLRRIKVDERWLGNLRLNFTNDTEEKSVNKPAFPKIRIAAVVAGMLIFVFLGGGLVSSVQAALPIDTLYGLKLFSEQVQSFLVFGDENKINFILKLAEKRLEEAEDQTQIILATVTEDIDEDEEIIIVGTIFRAQDNLERAGALIKKVSASGKFKNLKKAEKALERLERLAKRKNQMAEKFAKKLPSIAAALNAIDFISVDIEEEANKIIITINLEEIEDEDEKDNDENDNDENGDENEDEDEDTSSSDSKRNSFYQKRAEQTIARAEKKIELVENKLERFLNGSSTIFLLMPFIESNDDNEDNLKNLRKDLRDLLKAKGKLKKIHKNGIDRKSLEKLIERFENSFKDAAKELEEARNKLRDAQEEFAEGDYKKAIKKANEAFKKAVKAESKINRGRLFEELPDEPEGPEEPEEDTAPPVISQIFVEASTTSATINWLTDEPASSLINYGTSTNYTKAASNTELVTSHTIAIENLTASSTIHFQVRSEDANGNVATSTDLTFTTLEPEPEPDITPPVISSVAASNVSSSSATVSWITDELTTSTLYYSPVSPVEPAGTSTVIYTDTEFLINHSLGLTNLNASSTYYFVIKATDISGNTATSSESSFETTG